MPNHNRPGPSFTRKAPDAVIAYRFLLARTYLIVLSLIGLLVLFVFSLVVYTLWERSELANANYEELLHDIARQEYFVEQFGKFSPTYLCNVANCLPPALPPPGQFVRMASGREEPFYLLRTTAPDASSATATAGNSAALNDVLNIGMRFVQFDTVFWRDVQSQEKSVFMAADGRVAFFVPHEPNSALPTAKALDVFAQHRLAAIRAVLAGHATVTSADASSAHWAGPVTDPMSGRSVFICFLPIRDATGKVIAYASTDIAPSGLVPRALAHAPSFKGDFLLFSAEGFLVQRVGHTTPIFDRGEVGKPFKEAADHSFTFSLRPAVVRMSHVVPGLRWRVVYAVRLSSILAEKSTAIGLATLLCGFLCLVTGLSARRILHRVIRPAALQAQRLAESEQFNRTIIETSPVGLAVLRERDGALIMQNARFVPLAEWHVAGQPGGRAALALRQSAEAEAELAPLQMESAARARHYKVDLARAMHDGVPVLLCALTDITEQKRIEEVLEQARSAAEAASASKSLFLATLSHNIRTPLYGMLASIELIDKTTLDQHQHQLINVMDSAAQTLKDVLNDALDFTKIEAGELALDAVPFDLTDEIERVVRGFWSRAVVQSIMLHCFVAPELSGEWRGDALKIRHILNNLLNNAVKFSEDGEVTVSAALVQASAAHNAQRVRLSIRDTGPGIDAQNLERIFLPFEQVRTTTSEKFSGTGLGLSICRRYAQALRGRLGVKSVVGSGSIFFLEIPLERQAGAMAAPTSDVLRGWQFQIDAPRKAATYLAAVFVAHGGVVSECANNTRAASRAYVAQVTMTDMRPSAQRRILLCIDPSLPFEPVFESNCILVTSLSQKALVAAARLAAEVPASPAVRAPASASHHTLSNIPVLVVDDQSINRIVVQQQLLQLGCSVESAASGAEALANLARRRYALILTDINMPDMNGYEFAERCRAMGDATPIVAATAAALPGERERCLRAGMNDYLLKPFSLTALVDLLERYVPAAPLLKVGVQTTNTADTENTSDTTASHTLYDALQKWDISMIDTVLESLAKDTADLHDALTDAQATRLGQIVHRVEGSMVALDIRPAMALCRAIHDCIEYEWLDQAFDMGSTLGTMLRQTMADVRAM